MRHYGTEPSNGALHCAAMDPAIFKEAEQARLAERTQKAKQQVSQGLRRLDEQRSLVDGLERHNRPVGAAKLALVSLLAAQRLADDYYERLVTHLNSICETPPAAG
jgi:hypothetical protein